MNVEAIYIISCHQHFLTPLESLRFTLFNLTNITADSKFQTMHYVNLMIAN